MRLSIPPPVLPVMDTLIRAGFQAYLVGGTVRDLILGRTPKDLDVATSAVPSQAAALFPRVALTGVRYGTITVLGDTPVEVTTFRHDGKYLDGRRPSAVSFSQSLEGDVKRRDFTMNALALDRDGTVIDHVGGLLDLENRVIRCVGDPGRRFAEDALRMLRAYRFLSQLGHDFMLGDAESIAIKENAHLVKAISQERIRDELEKTLLGDRPQVLFDIRQSGLLRHIIPELDPDQEPSESCDRCSGDRFWHIVECVAACPPQLAVRLTALLHEVGGMQVPDATQPDSYKGDAGRSAAVAKIILERLRFPSKTVDHVSSLIRQQGFLEEPISRPQVRGLLGRLGPQKAQDLFYFLAAHAQVSGTTKDLLSVATLRELTSAILKDRDPLRLTDMAVGGRELMEWGVPQGPALGEALDFLMESVISDPRLNSPKELKKLLFAEGFIGEERKEF